MIEKEHEKIRAVAWSEIFPWLNLFRTFRLAIRIRALLFATAALLLTVYGWALIDWAFSGGQSMECCATWSRLTQTAKPLPVTYEIEYAPVRFAWIQLEVACGQVGSTWTQMSSRFAQIFSPNTTFVDLIHWLFSVLWIVAVWAGFGGAITRSAALELATDERVGNNELCDFVKRRWRAYFAAPFFPLLGVLLATIGIGLVGILLNTGLSMWIAAIVWPLLLIGGLMMAVLLLGLWFGWPLMWPTISSEGTDSFDALSRTYAYVFQKPLHYLFYIFVAALFGAVGWLLVSNFAGAVIALTDWAASWGCGHDKVAQIVGSQSQDLGIGTGAAALISFWRDCVRLLAVGFLFSYFWTASTAIYFLLRRGVDATEMDEVFLDDERAEEVYGLPKVDNDEQGAPVVDSSDATQPADKPTDE